MHNGGEPNTTTGRSKGDQNTFKSRWQVGIKSKKRPVVKILKHRELVDENLTVLSLDTKHIYIIIY